MLLDLTTYNGLNSVLRTGNQKPNIDVLPCIDWFELMCTVIIKVFFPPHLIPKPAASGITHFTDHFRKCKKDCLFIFPFLYFFSLT